MEGKELAICRGHEDRVASVCVTNDGNIVSGSWDSTVRVWDMQGKELAICKGHEYVVYSVCVTADGNIVSGSADKTVRVWDIGLLGRIVRMDEDQARALWELLHNASKRSEIDKQGPWKAIEKILGEDAPEVKKGDLGRFSFEQINSVPGDMGNRIILDKILRLGGPMFAKEVAVGRGHEDVVWSARVTKDDKIVAGSSDGTVHVWDMQGKELAAYRGHEDWVCVTKDGKIVLKWDKVLRVRDTDGNQFAECRGHEGSVYSYCVTDDGNIVSGSKDKTVRVWDMQGKLIAVCRGHEALVSSVCVTNDGKIVSGSYDKTVRVWDMQGKELVVCRGHEHWIESVCIANDGKIVSGSYDKTVRVWDMQGKALAICRGHAGRYVYSVCIANDGKIVSGSYDGTVRVWDIGLLGRIARMDEDQARALWTYVRNFPHDLDQQTFWREIEKILGEDAQVAQAKINNNNNE